MRLVLSIIAIATLAMTLADSASARPKHRRLQAQCVDQPYRFSWGFLLPGQPAPQPNGCSPPVYQYNRFIGQDPDPNIRFQLRRDPATGYAPL